MLTLCHKMLFFARMKTYRDYLTCLIDVEANSLEEVEDVISEMDYNFSHNENIFSSEICDTQEIKEIY
jgi:hypothetical protein